MPNIVKNLCFLLFFCSFAWGVFYVSNSQSFLHFTEKVFLGEIGEKVSTIVGNFSIELEGDDDEEILGLKATPQSADWTAPICTATYTPSSWTSGSVQVTLMCSEPVEFCTMSDYSDCPQPQSFQPEPGMPCWRAQDITYNGYTIMACNLGATEVGTGVASYGYYYQRGNNYPMGDGTVTTYTPNNSTAVNASAYWPSNPYSSDTFIKRNSWDSSNNKNLRGGTGDTTTANGAGTREDRQGPCPSGYHVPSVYERNELLYGIPSSATGVAFLTNTLFLPLAGWRNYSTPSLQKLWTNGYYSASSPYNNYAYSLNFTTSTISTSANQYRGYGMPVRCFKNEYTSPFTPCESAPDIQYNGFTIKACNLGATEVFASFHPKSATMYGNYYQRGNNYPMGDYSVTTYTPNSSTKVSAAGFWPNNPFSSATFIKASQWDSSNNKNLRWGSGDTLTGNGAGTREDRQGPCPSGYHVPSALERNQLLLGIPNSTDGASILEGILYLPRMGIRGSSDAKLTSLSQGRYLSSSPRYTAAYGIIFVNNAIYGAQNVNAGDGMPVRCFLNTYESQPNIPCDGAPDITYNGITIQACNLGATEVFNLTNPTTSFGYYYQRGNNYPMWDVSVATYTPNSTTAVDASTSWPNNPFSSATFIRASQWDSSNNKNLRWGLGDTTSANGTGTQEDRQGPCPDGYHIPSILERNQLLEGATAYDTRSILRLPKTSYREYNFANYYEDGRDKDGYYRSSSPYTNTSEAYYKKFSETSFSTNTTYRGRGLPIRCFKNS